MYGSITGPVLAGSILGLMIVIYTFSGLSNWGNSQTFILDVKTVLEKPTDNRLPNNTLKQLHLPGRKLQNPSQNASQFSTNVSTTSPTISRTMAHHSKENYNMDREKEHVHMQTTMPKLGEVSSGPSKLVGTKVLPHKFSVTQTTLVTVRTLYPTTAKVRYSRYPPQQENRSQIQIQEHRNTPILPQQKSIIGIMPTISSVKPRVHTPEIRTKSQSSLGGEMLPKISPPDGARKPVPVPQNVTSIQSKSSYTKAILAESKLVSSTTVRVHPPNPRSVFIYLQPNVTYINITALPTMMMSIMPKVWLIFVSQWVLEPHPHQTI